MFAAQTQFCSEHVGFPYNTASGFPLVVLLPNVSITNIPLFSWKTGCFWRCSSLFYVTFLLSKHCNDKLIIHVSLLSASISSRFPPGRFSAGVLWTHFLLDAKQTWWRHIKSLLLPQLRTSSFPSNIRLWSFTGFVRTWTVLSACLLFSWFASGSSMEGNDASMYNACIMNPWQSVELRSFQCHGPLFHFFTLVIFSTEFWTFNSLFFFL